MTVNYRAPAGEDARFYGWFGEADFGPHLARVLAARRPGSVELVWHPPLRVADYTDRKRLARDAEVLVRESFAAD